MRISLLLPLSLLALSGCIDVHEHPAPQPQATVVTPPPPPTTTYVTPVVPGTVVTTP